MKDDTMTTITATRSETRTTAPRRSARTMVASARNGKVDINWRVLRMLPQSEGMYCIPLARMGVRRN